MRPRLWYAGCSTRREPLPTAARRHAIQTSSASSSDLADKLGARVVIQQGAGGKGKLVVSYNSLDELDGILAHIQ